MKIPRIRFTNYRRLYPNMHPECFTKWLAVRRYWHGRIITIHCKALAISLDFRRNWLSDMKGIVK